MTSVTPRWRVSRSEETPVAGPSRLPDAEPHVSDSAQSTDAEFPTPKLATLSLAQNATNSSVGHALKLRELLDRMPKEKEDSDSAATTPVVRKPAVPLSDVESDLEFPNITVGEPSHAQESLKDLFSRIWTQPGNTPEKRTPGRPRRNSVDVSEVESSPRVQRERSANKGHRKSMSDEETEKQGSNNRDDGSEVSFTSSKAATFDLLRQRLNDSQTNILNQAPPTLNNIYSTIDNDTDNDTETFFRGISESGQYPATSTPQDGHSLRLSTNSEDPFQSRLLDYNNSTMQRDMDRFDSPDVSRISPSLPPSETVRGNPTTPRLRTNSAASSFARPTEASRRHSTGLQHSSSRSNLKASTTKDAKVPASPRAPKPLPKSPAAHRHSYHELLGRKASTSSLRSDASTNSLASSVASRSPRQSPTSPRRVRTLSTPARPSEPQLRASSSKPNSQKGSVSSHPRSPPNDEERDSNGSSRPVRQGGHSPSPAFNRSQSMQSSMQLTQPIARQRHNSTSSLASSISSHSHDDSEEEEEEVHERERNWNNPHPKWTHHSPRAPSPLPRSRPSSPLPMSLPSATPAKSTLSHPTERTRHDSLIVPGSPSVSSSSRTARRSPSPQPGTSRLPRANNTKGQSPKSPNVTPHLGKRANQTVDSSRTIDLSTISPERPKMSRPTSLHGSHLPMRASTVTHPPPHPAGASRSPNSHSRSQSVPSIVVDEHASGTDDLFTTSDAATPPSIQRVLPLSPSPSTDADEPDSAPPILRRSTTPDISLKHTRETSDESRLQRSLRSPPSPPPSPPTETRNGSNSSILVTPPRKTALSSPPHLEYKTPSPPKNLPELPGPPSSDDDTGPLPPSPTFRTPARALLSGNQSTFKTPAPPGAWSATPLPSLKDKLIPHQEIEPDPSQRSPGFSGEQNFSFPNYPKTPKPPGGWQDTPAIPPRTLNMPMLEDDDSAVDSGLATPAPSLGRSSGLPFATPAPPGAYAVTPTPRKSILKVRFEEEAPTSDPASTDAEEGKQELDSFPSFSLPSPTSPSRGHKRATSVRLLDSSGQSKVDDDVPSQPQRPQSHKRNVTTVRIVDSMGREIEPSPLLDLSVVKDEAENSVELSSEESIALTRDEALARVKRGLSDLTVGLQELEGTHSFSSDDPQLRKLKDISETARQAQDGLKATLSTKNNGKLSSLKRKLSNVLWPGSSRSALVIASVFHVILFYFLLRLLTTSAHKYFLTTYYDPFYPDIHMYTSIPTPQRQTPLFRAALIGGDWKTMAGSFWETLALTFLHYQQDMWERWGHNSAQNMLWPPE